jgi:hypothetical protein
MHMLSPCFQHIAPLNAPLPGSLARQLFRKVTNFKISGRRPAELKAFLTAVGRHAALHSFSEGPAGSLLHVFPAINKILRF